MSFFNDTRFTLRLFYKNTISSFMGVSVFGLGLAMSITMFTMVKGFLWTSPNVRDGGQLVSVEWLKDEANQDFEADPIITDYEYIKENSKSFKELAAFQFLFWALNNPDGDAYTARYPQAKVSTNFFDIAPVRPILGRLPSKEDIKPGGSNAVAISYSIWQEQYGGAAEVLGATAILNGESYIIVGVLPAGYEFPVMQESWILADWKDVRSRPREKQPSVEMFGILKDGVSTKEAEIELNNLAAQLARLYPETNEHYSRFIIKPYAEEFVGDEMKQVLLILLLCSVLVFLIACANVSNLVLARVSKRQQELAIRSGLGASRIHLMGMVLLDGAVMAVGGLIVGILIALWSSRYLWEVIDGKMPFRPEWWNMDIDMSVMLFAAFMMFMSVLISSLFPALRVVAKQNNALLKDDTRTSSSLFIGRLSKVLISIQVTFSTVLLITALTMVLTSSYVANPKLPYDPEKIMTTRMQMNVKAGFESIESVHNFYDDLIATVSALPNVETAGLSYKFAGFFPARRPFEIFGQEPDRAEDLPKVNTNIINTSYFDVYKAEPVSGRFFSLTDTESTEYVCVVNQHFVKHFFPGENPIGKRIRVKNAGTAQELQNIQRDSPWTEWMTVVGVAPNLQQRPVPGEPIHRYAEIYIPTKQRPSRGMNLLVHAKRDVLDVIEPVRKIVQRKAPLLAPQSEFESVADVLERANSGIQITTNLITVFGVAALFMASIGLYALISFTTQQKIREFGIRMALGASAQAIIKLVFRKNLLQIVIGLILGMAAGVAISSVLKKVFDAANLPVAVPAFSIAITIVMVASAVAILIPALRAASIEPNKSLKQD